MPAYFIAYGDVQDWERFDEYRRRVMSTAEGFDARVLAAGRAEGFEGDAPRDHTVIVRFPSAVVAREWYDSPGYKAIRSIRQEAVPGGTVLLLDGAAPG